MKTFWRVAGGVLILGLPVFLLFFFLQDRGDADGHIEIKTESPDPEQGPFSRLMLDGVDYGRNYHKPERKEDWGHPEKDRSRLATTYYYQGSPVGLVLRGFDWFSENKTPNSYRSDARMPASLLALSAPVGVQALPVEALAGLWSEPPLGVIGLNCGTPASYARPYQHIHFYERGSAIVKHSFPEAGKSPTFRFVEDAIQRGSIVQLLAGDERETMAKQGPDSFYHVLLVETARAHPDRPVVKRLSREAMALYAQKLAPGGVICYHTSSRNFDLAPLLGDIAKDLGMASLAAHDIGAKERKGDNPYYGSSWFLVARQKDDLDRVRDRDKGGANLTWYNPPLTGRLVMTDAQPRMIRDARGHPQIPAPGKW